MLAESSSQYSLCLYKRGGSTPPLPLLGEQLRFIRTMPLLEELCISGDYRFGEDAAVELSNHCIVAVLRFPETLVGDPMRRLAPLLRLQLACLELPTVPFSRLPQGLRVACYLRGSKLDPGTGWNSLRTPDLLAMF